MSKKIRIRDSKSRDVGLFRKLWKAYLEENEKDHSIVSCTDKNVENTEQVFTVYTQEQMQGFVLFVGDYAMLMAGDAGTETDYNCGKTATLWCIYVQNDKRKVGVATALIEEAKKRLKAAGFNSVITNITIGNEAAGRLALKLKAKPVILTSVISVD